MRRIVDLLAAVVFATSVSSSLAADRPNIVLIIGDDIGYADYGCYGGDIATPNIDQLARDGLQFRQFYNNAVCVPTRYSTFSGMYPRYVGEKHRILLEPEVTTLTEVLRAAGYRASMSGKWHLGRSDGLHPNDRGFEEYYGLTDGCCNQFNPVQRDPPFEGGRIRTWMHNRELVTEFPDDFYATDAISDHACKQIRKFAAGDAPFFVHVAYTAAHSPLHAKPHDIAKYADRYVAGWDIARALRHARQLELGVVDKTWKLPGREREFPAWVDEPLKEWNAKLMAVYAAMVDSVDQGIGRILQTLEETGRRDDTIVLVFNDNGGCAEQAGGDDPTNIAGPKEHYVSCGAGWAWVQNVPFRRYKAWCHEGGIATPLVVRWPGTVPAGAVTQEVGHIVDLLPTLVELAGAKSPANCEGVSLVPVLKGGKHAAPRTLYWAWQDNRAMREGDWKIAWEQDVRRWELYDLSVDRTEMHDLATTDPERLLRMAAAWQGWAERTGAVHHLGEYNVLKPKTPRK